MGIRATVHAQREGTGPFGSTIETIDLDKSWHGLHFLLSGTKEPGSLPEHFLNGESPLPDIGDASIFFYGVAQVQAIDGVLQACTPEVLLERYDGRLMRELDIYPGLEWDHRDFAYLLENYEILRHFVSRHATEGNELLVILS